MVADGADGRRVAELLASELDGRDLGALAGVAVTDADRNVEGTVAGERAYDVTYAGERLAGVFVHPERARVEFAAGLAAARTAAADADLRVRPKASTPPRLVVFVEDGADVKRILPAVRAAVDALDDPDGESAAARGADSSRGGDGGRSP